MRDIPIGRAVERVPGGVMAVSPLIGATVAPGTGLDLHKGAQAGLLGVGLGVAAMCVTGAALRPNRGGPPGGWGRHGRQRGDRAHARGHR